MAHITMSEFRETNAFMRGNRLAFRSRIGWLLPGHVGDVISRTQVWCGIAMTIEAKLHRERLGAIGERHLIDASMAAFATDAFGDVDVVPEENEIRKLGHPRPTDGLVFGKALADGRQHRSIGPDLRVTGHAGLRRRQSRLRSRFDAGMAIAAIDSQFARMMPVTEGNRL